MKKSIPYFLMSCLFLASYTMSAQEFSIEPSTVAIAVDPDQFEGVGYSFVVNQSADTTYFVWEREVIATSQGWQSAVCDKNMCHAPSVSTQNFWLEPGGEGTMDVHLYPSGNEGSAIIKVHVWDVADPETVVTGNYLFNESVSVAEKLTESIQLYPNPTADQLFVAQGSAVSRIELFSLTGKQVVNASLNADNVVSVGHLPAGTYVARLFDNSGKQVSSNVVIKK